MLMYTLTTSAYFVFNLESTYVYCFTPFLETCSSAPTCKHAHRYATPTPIIPCHLRTSSSMVPCCKSATKTTGNNGHSL
uniref:Uncharacterized protein n=1 Tax=Aegilops tauschii subsp. strangulata TaxID=200361 RepID=A0A453RY05_AEGTS